MSYTVRVTHRTQQNYQYHNHIIVQVFLKGAWNNPTWWVGGEDRELPPPKQFLISIIAYRLFDKLKCLKEIFRYTKQCFHAFLSCSKLVFHSSFCSNKMNTINVKTDYRLDQLNTSDIIQLGPIWNSEQWSKHSDNEMDFHNKRRIWRCRCRYNTSRQIDRKPFWK